MDPARSMNARARWKRRAVDAENRRVIGRHGPGNVIEH
jgi:hypothetical protein